MTKSTRNRNLVLAAVLAAVAALLTAIYVSRSQGSASAASGVASAPVLVATRDLPVGTPASVAFATGAIVLKRLPTEAVAPTAVNNAALLAGGVVIQPIFKGDQVTFGRFGPTAAQGLRANLHGALRAVAVPGDPTQLLSPTLNAGDRVDVVALIDGKSRVVLHDLLVLAAPTAGTASGQPAVTYATVQLTDRQAQSLFWVMKNAAWSFVLRPSAKAKDTATAPATARTVLEGQ